MFNYTKLHAAQVAHPVVPAMPLERLQQLQPEQATDLVRQRAQLIADMAEDRLQHTYRPPAWRRIDLMVARKRLAHPGACIELYVLGGHDSGKTDGAVCALARHFWYTRQAWVWGLHSTQTSSKTIHQARMWDFFPKSERARVGQSGGVKRKLDSKMKYGEGQGFTNDSFNLKRPVKLPWAEHPVLCGGLAEFKFFASNVDNLQGAKITCANSDELVDQKVARTVRQRMIPRAGETRSGEFLHLIQQCVDILESGRALPAELHGQLYTGVHIMGFTPMQGYSPLVAAALDGAMDIELEDAACMVPLSTKVPESFPCVDMGNGKKKVHLLPVKDSTGALVGSLTVPRFKQPKKDTALVAYLYTSDNPYTNLDGKLEDLDGQNENEIRITFFGDVRKNWQNKFSSFTPQLMPQGHVCTSAMVPRVGTWYHTIDFATGRNWFMNWVLVDPQDRKFLVREWPQAGDYIPENDVGDPGDWAVSAPEDAVSGDKVKRDGYPGPAQEDMGLGFVAMKREIARVEAELGAWWSKDGSPITVEKRLGDSRLGSNPTTTSDGSTSIIEELNDMDVDVEPASGRNLADGDQLIKDSLAYDTKAPMSPLNSPGLLVHEDCKATLFMFSVYTGQDGAKGATKDPRDTLAMCLLGDPTYMEGGAFTISR